MHKIQYSFIRSLAAKCSGNITQNENNAIIEGRIFTNGAAKNLRLLVECLPEKNGKIGVSVVSAPQSTNHREVLGLTDIPIPHCYFNCDDGQSRIISKVDNVWEKIASFAVTDFLGASVFDDENFQAASVATANQLCISGFQMEENTPTFHVILANNEKQIVVKVIGEKVYLLGLKLPIEKANALLAALL